MTTGLWTLLLAPLLASPLEGGSSVELRYTGSLNKVNRESEGTPVKRFSLFAFVTPLKDGMRETAFVMDERGAGSWGWPERFGRITFDANYKATSPVPLRLLYDHQGVPTVVNVVSPLFPHPERLKAGAKWNEGKEAWEVIGTQKIQDRSCWHVEITTNFGRKRSLYVEAESPIVVSFEERVFIGQGEEFTLKMQLDNLKTLDEKQTALAMKPWEALLKLKADLLRPDADTKTELTEAQLKIVSDVFPKLNEEANDTPFSHLASVIGRDLKSQMQRYDEVVKLAQKFVGQPAPELSLKTIDKTVVDPASLKGKIVVLHFWEYQGEPLIEPYGQVGYLDFLYSKRRKLGVQVFGVAVDNRLNDDQTRGAALRSVGGLKNFMNLGYSIAVDDGKLLGKFGDPRRAGAKLPLWVVIDPEGKIAHYHVGFYKINPDEGLREVDELLVKLIREQKAKEPAGN